MSITSSPTVFVSYSHLDEEWKDRLVRHLQVSQQQGLLFAWEDRLIGGGEDWFRNIQAAMEAASVAVLLVSANSLTSEFILREEVKRLLQRRDSEGLRIFPVIIKPCDWEAVPWLRSMNLRPRDGRPISGGTDYQIDVDFAGIAREIRQLLGSMEVKPPRRGPLGPESISLGRLPVTGRDLFGRESELEMLDRAWADPGTHIHSLVAWGGVGKSALVNHWLARMARDDYRGATRVYGWSFYSQGTTDRAVSADQFIEAALVFFGDRDPNRGSPWDKGERLARLVGEQRALLVLDGLEPLQYPPGPDEGKLKDQALQSLLRQLAAHNEGLCVLTTRVTVADLSSFEGSTVIRRDLENLTPEAGALVLRAQGVQGDAAELQQASREFGGHSLALTLLGSYLSDVHGGDIARRTEVRGLEDDERHGRHAQRVMASYERWFGEGPELDVLRILGLFNRPADKGSVDALRAAPAIPGLTNHLQDLNPVKWQQLLSRLRRAGLLAASVPAQPDPLDTHPLIREHFGRQLQRASPDAWREGNNRLYEHLKRSAKEFPETIDEMAPLYAAVAHGCAAGKHREALVEVYWKRVLRERVFFSVNMLGAYGADLAALSGFFDQLWLQPVAVLAEGEKQFVLAHAGAWLRAVGRLIEATQSIEAGLEGALASGDWENASIGANNLSELYLIIGDLTRALSYAQQSIGLADKSGDKFQQLSKRTTLANTLCKSGRLSDAEAAFREAEVIQREYQPQFPLLYSVPGFVYCELLLEQGRYDEVLTHSLQTLVWVRGQGWVMDTALNHLSIGRAYLLKSQEGRSEDWTQAIDNLKRAVEGLRQAGTLHHLPRGLLARAKFYRVRGEYDPAANDLDEAMSIATRGSMGLYEADCHLEYARLSLAQKDKVKAREHLLPAKEMIGRMGYHLRDEEMREIERQLNED